MSVDWSITVVGIGQGRSLVNVAYNEEDFLRTTVNQLAKKISDTITLTDPEFMRLFFAGKYLIKFTTLQHNNIKIRSAILVVLRLHPQPQGQPLIGSSSLEYITLRETFADLVEHLAENEPVINQLNNRLFSSNLIPNVVRVEAQNRFLSPYERANKIFNAVLAAIKSHPNPNSAFTSLITALHKVGLTTMETKLTDCFTKKGGHIDAISVTTTLSVINRVPVPPTSENKEYPRSFVLPFTDEPDCLDPFPDPNDPKRVKMKCGHGVEPNSLTAYCRSLLDANIFKFTCPAIVSRTNKKCGKEWEYTDIRLAALLTDDEMQYFESKLSEYAASQYCDINECPGCRSFTERLDLNNLRVHCPFCTKKKGRDYYFCWRCLREWTGPTTSSEKCGNESCSHPDMPSIRNAPNVQVCGETVPNRRACPTCGKVIENKYCKNVICPRCKKEFCFLCLELTIDCLKNGSWYGTCAKPVAPKQTHSCLVSS